MRAVLIPRLLPQPTHYLCLVDSTKPFHMQARVTHASMATLRVGGLPPAARFDSRGLHLLRQQPALHSVRHNLRARITVQLGWGTVVRNQPFSHLPHPTRPHRRRRRNGVAFSRELVRDG